MRESCTEWTVPNRFTNQTCEPSMRESCHPLLAFTPSPLLGSKQMTRAESTMLHVSKSTNMPAHSTARREHSSGSCSPTSGHTRIPHTTECGKGGSPLIIHPAVGAHTSTTLEKSSPSANLRKYKRNAWTDKPIAHTPHPGPSLRGAGKPTMFNYLSRLSSQRTLISTILGLQRGTEDSASVDLRATRNACISEHEGHFMLTI